MFNDEEFWLNVFLPVDRHELKSWFSAVFSAYLFRMRQKIVSVLLPVPVSNVKLAVIDFTIKL